MADLTGHESRWIPGSRNPMAVDPTFLIPKPWRKRSDLTLWWCSRCRVIWVGLQPGMYGGCAQPRPYGRCGTILERVSR
jgi:hypothetical protein